MTRNKPQVSYVAPPIAKLPKAPLKGKKKGKTKKSPTKAKDTTKPPTKPKTKDTKKNVVEKQLIPETDNSGNKRSNVNKSLNKVDESSDAKLQLQLTQAQLEKNHMEQTAKQQELEIHQLRASVVLAETTAK